jgi:arylformamidase
MEYHAHIYAGDIILLKTANSSLGATALFNPSFVYLEASGAHYLQEKKIKAVGIDYLGIERAQPAHETHLQLMEHGITIIEGLRLQHVKQGRYLVCCLPLNAVGIEAAPARAVLIEGI